MSHRREQVESLLTQALSQVLQRDVSDPRIVGMVSITRISVSPDLKQATVYVSVLPDKYESRTIHGLQDASGHLHKQLMKRVALRIVPRLHFQLDDSLKKQSAIFEAIHEGMARSGPDPDAPPDESDASSSAAPPTEPS